MKRFVYQNGIGAEAVRIAGIEPNSVVDGVGARFTVFMQGCRHNCEGCHNPSTHDFEGGTIRTVESILKAFDKTSLNGKVTISGGDPFFHVDALYALLKGFSDHNATSIWVYTGFTYSSLITHLAGAGYDYEDVSQLLSLIDILVDGPFVLAQRTLELPYRGSSNQRLINVARTLSTGKPVEWKVNQ